MSIGINELKRRTNALGIPAPAEPISNNIPTAALKEIGDLLSRQRDPTEDEKREMKRTGQTVFATPETLSEITEILEKYGVNEP